jgi:hypothetical protein
MCLAGLTATLRLWRISFFRSLIPHLAIFYPSGSRTHCRLLLIRLYMVDSQAECYSLLEYLCRMTFCLIYPNELIKVRSRLPIREVFTTQH